MCKNKQKWVSLRTVELIQEKKYMNVFHIAN